MERLKKQFKRRLSTVPTKFRRYLYDYIDWTLPLILITGPRGSGKTVMLLQYLKFESIPTEQALFVSLDDIYFESNPLIYLAEEFYERGGRYLLLDEIHKYPRWAKDLKVIYDTLPGMQVIATGSSTLNLLQGEGDLSRRAGFYHLPSLSFREYLIMEEKLEQQPLTLSDILNNHASMAAEISDAIDVLPLFRQFMKKGAFPFYREAPSQYYRRLMVILNTVLESDIPAIHNIDYQTTRNLKKLLSLVSESAPFQPNISDLGRQTGINRTTILKLLGMLDQASILNLLRSAAKGSSYWTKPDKIFLYDTNLLYALSGEEVNPGQIRETFFMNQLGSHYPVNTPRYGDFLIRDGEQQYVFEVGGPSKNAKQISGVPNAYLAIDDLEQGAKNRIPLWLFGFLY